MKWEALPKLPSSPAPMVWITGFLYDKACENAFVSYKTLRECTKLISGCSGWLGVGKGQRLGRMDFIILENVIFIISSLPHWFEDRKLSIFKIQTKFLIEFQYNIAKWIIFPKHFPYILLFDPQGHSLRWIF